jgi:transposase
VSAKTSDGEPMKEISAEDLNMISEIDQRRMMNYFSALIDLSFPDGVDSLNQFNEDDSTFARQLIKSLQKARSLLDCSNSLMHDHRIRQSKRSKKIRKIRPRFNSDQRRRIYEFTSRTSASQQQVAKVFGCSRSIVARIIKKYKNEGPTVVAPKSQSFHACKVSDSLLPAISRSIEESSGAISGRQLRNFIDSNFGISISLSSAYRMLKCRLGYRLRKIGKFTPDLNTDLAKDARVSFVKNFINLCSRSMTPISIDECGFSRKDGRRYSWSRCGSLSRISSISCAHRVNLLAAISPKEILGIKMGLGKCNQWSIIEFLNSIFVSLKAKDPDFALKYFIVLDNAAFHKTPHIYALLSRFGVVCLFNCPYACFFNPVELFFNYLKTEIRSRNISSE